MYSNYRMKLVFELMALQNVFVDDVLLFKQNMQSYDDLMQKAIADVNPYFDENKLEDFHQSTKEAVLPKVWKLIKLSMIVYHKKEYDFLIALFKSISKISL